MKKIYSAILFLMFFMTVQAQQEVQTDKPDEPNQTVTAVPVINVDTDLIKTEADSAYYREDYASAIAGYEQILQTGKESADVYYNLGNSYYKSKDIAKAILNYERAVLLNPGDNDIRFNLRLANTKTVDKITPVSEIFFITWFRSLSNIMNERGWSVLGVFTFLLALCMLALYIFARKISLKKIGFISAVVLVCVCVLANIFASMQKAELLNRDHAIVMAASVTVKSTPNESGTELFILHEGTKVQIKDNTMKEWKEIRLEDGNEGWVPTNAIEVI